MAAWSSSRRAVHPSSAWRYFCVCPWFRARRRCAGQRGVRGRHEPGVAVGREVLRGVEAERRGATVPADGAAAQGRAERLGGVLHEVDPVLLRQHPEGTHGGGQPVEVHGQDHPRARRDGGRDAVRVQTERRRIDVDEHGPGSELERSRGGGDERERRGHHLGVGADAERVENQLDRVRPRAETDRVVYTQVGRALGLERLAFGAQDELAAPQDVPDRRLDLRLDLLVLPRQVELRDLHWNPANPRPKPYCPSSSRLMLIRNSSSSTRSMNAAVIPQHCSRKSTSRRFSMTVPVSIL